MDYQGTVVLPLGEILEDVDTYMGDAPQCCEDCCALLYVEISNDMVNHIDVKRITDVGFSEELGVAVFCAKMEEEFSMGEFDEEILARVKECLTADATTADSSGTNHLF